MNQATKDDDSIIYKYRTKKKKELITIRQVFINPKSIETEKASYLIALVLKKKLYGKLQNTQN